VLVWEREEVQEMPLFTTIQLTGLDDVAKRQWDGHVRLYGYREVDAAKRVIGIAVREPEARDVMDQARYIGTMPKIEVDDRFWFYVAVIGDAVWEQGKEPGGA